MCLPETAGPGKWASLIGQIGSHAPAASDCQPCSLCIVYSRNSSSWEDGVQRPEERERQIETISTKAMGTFVHFSEGVVYSLLHIFPMFYSPRNSKTLGEENAFSPLQIFPSCRGSSISTKAPSSSPCLPSHALREEGVLEAGHESLSVLFFLGSQGRDAGKQRSSTQGGHPGPMFPGTVGKSV